MKRLLILCIVCFTLHAQNASGQNWLTTGNSGSGLKLGLTDNNPLRVYTSDIQRLKLNEDITYSVNGFNAARNGYMFLGHSQTYSSGVSAYSLLHLNGANGTFVQVEGYRPWMQTGMTLTDNNDVSYMGLRKIGTGTDLTETVLAWADNPPSSQYGPDDLVLRFLAQGEGVTTVSSDFTDPTDLDGLHVARFTGNGNIGFGPTFGLTTDNPNYVMPQSLLHLSRQGNTSTWLQITNEGGTDQTDDDGLRIGIGSGGAAYIRQQERKHFIIQTDWDNTPGGIADGERMRITNIGVSGVRNPAGAPNDNITRIAISHDGANPITDPVSLLHLGNDVGSLFPSDDGWRDWMDVGIFINKTNDNIYVGLKKEEGATPLDDRYDAVINWGDNQDAVGPLEIGPDNLRFIFTSTNDIGAGDPVSTSNNGLEVARMEPGLASTLPTGNYGMMGVGNFAPGSANDLAGFPVDAKLDIDGDLRIRHVTEDTTLFTVLVIDTNDLNRVHWRTFSGGGGGVGNYCSDPQNPLTGNYEIPLNDFNYYFTGTQPYPGSGFNTNGVGIGVPCSTDLWGKLHVVQDEVSFLNQGSPISLTAYFENNDDEAMVGIGVASFSQGVREIQNTGGYFEASNAAKENRGVEGRAFGITAGSGTFNQGGFFSASGGLVNYGIYASAGTPNGGNGPDWAGYFVGDVATTGGYYTASDETLKENIEPIQSATDILAQLNPVGYDMRYQQYSNMNLSREHQMGLIAQEVEQVLPDVVGDIVHPADYDSLGNEITPVMELKGVNYIQLIPLLIAGFQEQQALLAYQDTLNHRMRNKIMQLLERVAALEECVNGANLCGEADYRMGDDDNPGQGIELRTLNAIILDQNLPNPFAEQTTIHYVVPDEVMKAELVFYDMAGRIINQVVINERGPGKMTVFGENLQNGVYTYSLIADGKLIDTKRMVKK